MYFFNPVGFISPPFLPSTTAAPFLSLSPSLLPEQASLARSTPPHASPASLVAGAPHWLLAESSPREVQLRHLALASLHLCAMSVQRSSALPSRTAPNNAELPLTPPSIHASTYSELRALPTFAFNPARPRLHSSSPQCL